MQRQQMEMESNPGGKSENNRKQKKSVPVPENNGNVRGQKNKRHDSMDVGGALPPSMAKHRVLASSSSNHELVPGQDSNGNENSLHLLDTTSLPHDFPELPQHPTDTNSSTFRQMI